MERPKTALDLIDQPTHDLIRRKACRFARQRRCAEADDLEQEVLLQLLRRCHRFNPQKASWPAFSNVVCRTQLLSILDRHCAQSRTRRKEAASPNAPAQDGVGNGLIARLSSDCHAQRLGSRPPSEQGQSDLRTDLQATLALLPAIQRQICERLKVDTPTDVARDMGISRGTLYDHIGQIRERFDQAGLREIS
jgi:RNA polymerase sigma factor (sigma-70 family)